MRIYNKKKKTNTTDNKSNTNERVTTVLPGSQYIEKQI